MRLRAYATKRPGKGRILCEDDTPGFSYSPGVTESIDVQLLDPHGRKFTLGMSIPELDGLVAFLRKYGVQV
jgi:hypothetical protein